MKKVLTSLPARLVLGVALGLLVGVSASAGLMQVVATVKYVLGQLVFFMVPLIVFGFIAPSVAKLRQGASRLLLLAVGLAYASSVGAAALSAGAGYALIPRLPLAQAAAGLRQLPETLFQLEIPQVMSVMSALALSLLIGLAAAWTHAERIERALDEFQNIVLAIVQRVVIPVLPVFIAATFAGLAYEGALTRQLPVFLGVVLLAILGHYLWLAVLYGAAGLYARRNPLEVLRHYGPAYLTAVGTMSSAATLPVALDSARRSPALRRDVISFGVPLLANIHLCGSVLTEVFFVMAVSQVLYGRLPGMGEMALFIALLGVFAIGAPGVPGGTVMASLGLITAVLGFGETGTALMLTVFALQDSFGTACNITGDGALTLILSEYAERHGI